MPQRDLGRTGLLTDSPPPPPPVPVVPPPDFRRATELVADAEKAVVLQYKTLVRIYHASVLKLAGGGELDPAEVPEFERSVRLLKKTPEAIASDMAEGRRILAAKAWLGSYDERKNEAAIETEAATITQFDSQLQREISRVRSAAAPHHARLEQLLRNRLAVTNNSYAARSWDDLLSGDFKPDARDLDRIRSSL